MTPPSCRCRWIRTPGACAMRPESILRSTGNPCLAEDGKERELRRFVARGGFGLDAAVATNVDDIDTQAAERRCDQQTSMAARRIFLGAEDRSPALVCARDESI